MDNPPTTVTRLRVEEHKIIHIHRRLQQGFGMVKVHPGYEVEPDTLLGQGQGFSGFKIIDLAHELGCSPKDGILHLKRKLGQTIYQNEILAEKQGLFGMGNKTIQASNDATLQSYDVKTGFLKMKLLPKSENLLAGVYGVVDAIDSKKGEVTIRTQATVIHGLIGSGRERAGDLHVLAAQPNLLISHNHLSAQLSGKIIVGGSLIFADALQTCLSFGIAGVITGGLNASDYRKMAGGSLPIKKPQWSDTGTSIVGTEGFGSIAIGQDIFKILQASHGQFCLLDGNNRLIILPTQNPNSMIYIRKTKIPLTSTVTSNVVKTTRVKVGDQVRIVTPTSVGAQGTVEAIDQLPTILPSGIAGIMVIIATAKGKKSVPIENIEVI